MPRDDIPFTTLLSALRAYAYARLYRAAHDTLVRSTLMAYEDDSADRKVIRLTLPSPMDALLVSVHMKTYSGYEMPGMLDAAYAEATKDPRIPRWVIVIDPAVSKAA